MSKVSVTKRKLDALAAAISLKSGEDLPLTLDAMREAVNNITFPEPGDSFDGPIFTATDQSLHTVVCDKTYSEVGNLISNNVYYAKFVIPSSVSGSEEFVYYGTYVNTYDGDIFYGIYPVPFDPIEGLSIPITTMLFLVLTNDSDALMESGSVLSVALPCYYISGNYYDNVIEITDIYTDNSFNDVDNSEVVLIIASLDNGRSIHEYDVAGTVEYTSSDTVTIYGFIDDRVKITITHNDDDTYSATGEIIDPIINNQYNVHVTPTTSNQTIYPDEGYTGLENVTVYRIPENYGNTTGDDALSQYLLLNKTAHTNINGVATQITGTMPNRGAITATIDGLTTTSYTIPDGYHNGSGTVSLTNAIELALAAI